MYSVELTESYFPSQVDDDVREVTIGGLLRETATKYPHDIGLVEIENDGSKGRQWTYNELLNESVTLAKALVSRFKPGEHVTVWSPNTPEWILMEYACALSGIVLVTANPSFQEKELRNVIEQSQSVALFLVSEFRGNPMAEIGMRACEGISYLREITDMEDIVAMQQGNNCGVELPNVQAGDATMIQYTSGTTGFPKGAVLTHRGLVNNARFYAKRLQTHQKTVWANIMPLFHTSGCGMVTLGCLQAGCKMLIIKQFEPELVSKVIEREKVTTILGVPTMLVMLLESLAKHPCDISSMEMISSGGAMVAPELVRSLQTAFDCGFGTLYGQTETSPVITQHFSDDSLADICNTIGQPLPQTQVSVRSVEDNTVVPLDTVGEICVKAYCNMIGYYNNSEATRETYDSEGWLHTGDLGTMDLRGYVRITGRVKDMIIRGGENMFPAEIENVLLEHQQIMEVAVIGIPDKKWGEVIAAFIRSDRQIKLDKNDLHEHCRKLLSPQKTPNIWVQLESFPITGSGKIQKFKLRDHYLAGKYENL